MNWLIENWYIVVAMICAAAFLVYCGYTFFGMPTEKQKKKVKEWLIWACIEAEKALQSGTGQVKLRQVYDMFCAVPAFTWVARMITFTMFSDWVSDALVTMKEMLINNPTLAKYVYGDNANDEVAKIKEQLALKNS